MRSWVGASWLRLRRESAGPRGPGGPGGHVTQAGDGPAMSRFRRGRRGGNEDSPGDGYDGDAYDEDRYEGEPYRGEPARGGYPPNSGPYSADDYPRDPRRYRE